MATNLDIHEAQTASSAYQQLVADATARVQTGQLAAFRAVNKELIQLYWDLGKMIAERQQANAWGNSVVELLALDLQKAFPRSNGFSKTNFWRMRAFYLAYKPSVILPPPVGELPPDQNTKEFLPPAVAEIGWTHNYLILEKCKDPNERLFYIHQTRRFGWTKNVLIHQIENQSYEKTVIGQQNFEQNLPENLQAQAIFAVKDD